MVLFIVGATFGLIIGLARGGLLRSLVRHDINRPLLAFGVLSLLVLIRLGWVGDAGAILALTLGGAVVVALSNRHLAGMAVIAVGLIANFIPVALDGGTPVEPRAWRSSTAITPTLSPTQHLADHRTSLPILSSRIPLPAGNAVVSFGDLVIAVGLASLSANATRSRRGAGIPVAEILAGGPLTIDLFGSDPMPSPTIPSGWEPLDEDAAVLAAARLRPRISLSHPSMRLANR